MDYFDNGPFVANINEMPGSGGRKSVNGWLIASLVIVAAIASFFIYKDHKSQKYFARLKQEEK